MNQLKVIVAQIGARHNYAVARMLQAEGALAALYTDLCFHGPAGRLAEAAAPWVPPRLAGKLRRRIVQGVDSSRIFSAPDVRMLGYLKYARVPEALYEAQNRLFSDHMIKWGVRDANVVYAMWGSGSAFWRYARERGLKIAVDVFITPIYHRVVAQERQAFPDWIADWEAQSPATEALQYELIEAHVKEILETADLLICPSDTVMDGIKEFGQAPKGRIELLPRAVNVPYGYSLTGAGPAAPQRGRILFAGGADLRKGFPYLAEAASLLNRNGSGYEFRIAGMAGERVRNHPRARDLNFLGHLSRESMAMEYRRADVFVMPTIAEGSAGVVFEALASGVPVVTTRSAGSVVTNGQEGLIVPERDAEALAKAIERIVEDRAMRSAMSEAARSTIKFFDEDHWRKRLVNALNSLVRDEASQNSDFVAIAK